MKIKQTSERIADHQARNAASKLEGQTRRQNRRNLGEYNARIHNDKLKGLRLEKKRLATLKPYQMTYEQANLSEGTEDEGSTSTIIYELDMGAKAFLATLPPHYGTRVWDEFTEIFPLACCKNQGDLEAVGMAMVATVEIDRGDSMVISAPMHLVFMPDHMLSPTNQVFSDAKLAINEHIISLGGRVVEWNDEWTVKD